MNRHDDNEEQNDPKYTSGGVQEAEKLTQAALQAIS